MLLPNFNQLKLIKSILFVSDPLRELEEVMSSETNVTISELCPVYQQLELNLNKTRGGSVILNTRNINIDNTIDYKLFLLIYNQ